MMNSGAAENYGAAIDSGAAMNSGTAMAEAAEGVSVAADAQAVNFQAHGEWPVLQTMLLPLAVRIPLMRMTLKQVRDLTVGDVLESMWPVAEEVPLYAGSAAVSWCEFAVVDGVMAARLTRLG